MRLLALIYIVRDTKWWVVHETIRFLTEGTPGGYHIKGTLTLNGPLGH